MFTKRQLAQLLRRLADRLYPARIAYPPTCFGLPVEPLRIRSNYAVDSKRFNSRTFSVTEFKRYAAQELKDQIAGALHIVKEDDTYCVDLIILKPYEK